MNKRVNIIVVLSLLLVLVIIPSLCVSFTKASNESESIDAANSSINQAFTSVYDAQKAGANVTGLLTRLNTAGVLLAQADNAYHAGNLSNVTASADNARSIANQVNNDALNLKNDSINRSQNNFLLTCLFSFSAALIFVVVLLLAWRRLKRSYMKKLLDLKPQSVDNAI